MNRKEAFSLLGLHEDASRSQIDAAYRNRTNKYKAADYDDEPEYAKRKLSQLREAYSIATGDAAPSSERVAGSALRRSRHTTDDCDEHRFGSDSSEGGFFMSLKSLGKGDNKDRAPKKTFGQWRKAVDDKLRNYMTEDELMKSDISMEEAEAIVESLDQGTFEDESDGNLLPSDEMYESSEILSDEYQYESDDNGGSKTFSKAISILSFLMVLATFFMGIMDDDDIDYSSVDEPITYEESIYDSESDYHIYQLADCIFDNYAELDYSSEYEEKNYEYKTLTRLANKFADIYTDGEFKNFDNWVSELSRSYSEIDESYSSKQMGIRAVLNLFSFPSYETCLGIVDPATGEPIESFTEYLQFLIDYKVYMEGK